MNSEEIREVRWAIHEMYTLDEIFKNIKEGSWTLEMFTHFIKTINRRGY